MLRKQCEPQLWASALPAELKPTAEPGQGEGKAGRLRDRCPDERWDYLAAAR